MLGFMFNKIGGLVKDLQVAVTETAEYVYDEAVSIPEAFAAGYSSGLITSDTVETSTPVVDEPIVPPVVRPTPEEAIRRFGN